MVGPDLPPCGSTPHQSSADSNMLRNTPPSLALAQQYPRRPTWKLLIHLPIGPMIYSSHLRSVTFWSWIKIHKDTKDLWWTFWTVESQLVSQLDCCQMRRSQVIWRSQLDNLALLCGKIIKNWRRKKWRFQDQYHGPHICKIAACKITKSTAIHWSSLILCTCASTMMRSESKMVCNPWRYRAQTSNREC